MIENRAKNWIINNAREKRGNVCMIEVNFDSFPLLICSFNYAKISPNHFICDMLTLIMILNRARRHSASFKATKKPFKHQRTVVTTILIIKFHFHVPIQKRTWLMSTRSFKLLRITLQSSISLVALTQKWICRICYWIKRLELMICLFREEDYLDAREREWSAAINPHHHVWMEVKIVST